MAYDVPAGIAAPEASIIPSLTDYMAEHYQAEVIGADEKNPGFYTVEKTMADGSTQTMPVDVRKLMLNDVQKAGMADKINIGAIPLSSPERPLRGTGLSYMQQVSMARTHTANDQHQFLKDRFGEGNVKKTASGLSVRGDDGEWHTSEVDSSTAAIFSKSGVIAGSIAGAQLAAAGGPLAMVLGAGVGAAVSSMADISEAYAKGIRTDFDAKEVASEVGTEFLIGMAGEGAGQLLMATPAAMHKVFSKLKATLPENMKGPVAEIASSMNGVDKDLLQHTMNRPTEVIGHQKRFIQWADNVGPDAVGKLNPLRTEQMELVTQTVESAGDEMQRAYGSALENIAAPVKKGGFGVDLIAFDGNKIMTELQQQLAPRGLIDAEGNFIANKAVDAGKHGFSTGDINQLRKFYTAVKGSVEQGKGILPAKEVGNITLEEAHNLMKQANALISAGKGIPELGATAESKVALVRMKEGIESAVDSGLAQRSPEAAQFWQQTRQTYAQRSQWLSEMAQASGAKRIEGTLNKVLELQKGSPTAQALNEMSENIFGKEFRDSLINELMDRQAALETAALTKSGQSTGSFSSLVDKIMLPITSPRYTSRGLAKFGPAQFDKLQAAGKTSSFINSLTPKMLRDVKMNGPMALSAIIQTGVQSVETKQKVRQDFIQQGAKKIYGR